MPAETMTIREIPVDLIDDPQDPMREKLNEQGIIELLQSIKEVGLLQPITVASRGERFEVVAGHRRLAAFRLGAFAAISSRVVELNDLDKDIAKVHENLFREEVDAVDEAHFLALLHDKHGKSVAEIADLIKKSDGYVRGRMDLLSYPDYLREAVKEGKLSLSAAKWFNKIENEQVRRQYVEFGMRQGVNAMYAQAWYESWRQGSLSAIPANQPPPDFSGGEGYSEPLLECVVCGVSTTQSEHMLYYAHPECINEIARVRAEQVRETHAVVPEQRTEEAAPNL